MEGGESQESDEEEHQPTLTRMQLLRAWTRGKERIENDLRIDNLIELLRRFKDGSEPRPYHVNVDTDSEKSSGSDDTERP